MVLSFAVCNFAVFMYIVVSVLDSWLVGRMGMKMDFEFRLWQSLTRQTDLTAQLCSIMKDVRNVRGSAQKKIEKLRQLLSGVFSELTNFDEVNLYCLLMLKNMMTDYLCFVAN